MSNILILGGTGFVGRHLCEQLQRAGHRVTVATRQARRAQAVQHLPLVTVRVFNARHGDDMAQLVAGHDAVVNLVAILHGSARAFHAAHVEWPQQLAAACQAAGVRRLVHVSALGASAQAGSVYQRTKAQGEAALAAAAHTGAGLDLTVLRPSVIFGAGDRFLTLFGRMQAVLPVVPLAGADTRFQPIWVDDVAHAIVHALATPATVGQTVELVGPDVLTLADLVRLAGRATGHPRPVLGLPLALGYVQALLMQCLPGEPLLSTDNIAAMEVDNVGTPNATPLAGWNRSPASVAAIAPTYLGREPGRQGPRQRLVALRTRRR